MPHDISVFDKVNCDFFSFSISAIDDGEILPGRPFGSFSVLRRKSFDIKYKIVTFDDTRIIDMNLASEGRKKLVISMYLSYN